MAFGDDPRPKFRIDTSLGGPPLEPFEWLPASVWDDVAATPGREIAFGPVENWSAGLLPDFPHATVSVDGWYDPGAESDAVRTVTIRDVEGIPDGTYRMRVRTYLDGDGQFVAELTPATEAA
jgi:hypothetical protein